MYVHIFSLNNELKADEYTLQKAAENLGIPGCKHIGVFPAEDLADGLGTAKLVLQYYECNTLSELLSRSLGECDDHAIPLVDCSECKIARDELIATLKKCNWNQTKTARLLGTYQTRIHRLCRKYGITKESWKHGRGNNDT